MSIVKEVADGVALVADGIRNIQTIYNTIKEGKAYFATTHPEVNEDVVALCVELRKTSHAVAVAASIITHFRFNVTAQAIATEPTRFNDYFIQHKGKSENLKDQLNSLRGHCTKIKKHVDILEDKAKKAGLTRYLPTSLQ